MKTNKLLFLNAAELSGIMSYFTLKPKCPRSQSITLTKKIATLLFVLLLCNGCFPEKESKAKSEEFPLIATSLGEREFYIPKVYLDFPHTGASPEAILLQTLYPGSNVLLDATNKLWEKGDSWKSVNVLIQYNKNSEISFNDFTIEMINHFRASRIIGEEYELVHQTQEEGAVQDTWDMWIEKKDDKYVSFITCSEKILESDVPQCTHHFDIDAKLSINISYDKRALSDWRLIQKNAQDMIKSFESPDSARIYAQKHM